MHIFSTIKSSKAINIIKLECVIQIKKNLQFLHNGSLIGEIFNHFNLSINEFSLFEFFSCFKSSVISLNCNRCKSAKTLLTVFNKENITSDVEIS